MTSDIAFFGTFFNDGRVDGSGRSFEPNRDTEWGHPLFDTPSDTIVTGFGFKYSGAPVGGSKIIEVVDASEDPQIAVFITEDNRLSVKRGGFLLGVSELILTQDEWFYIEFKAVLDATFGWFEIRLNETRIMLIIEQNTSEQGSADASGVRIFQEGLAFTMIAVDDWYVVDSTGTVNNDWLGDVVIEGLAPVNSVLEEWTDSPSLPAGDHYQNIDDVTGHDTDATYQRNNVPNNTDSFGHAELSRTDGGIVGVQQTLFARNDSAGPSTMKTNVFKSSSEEADGPLITVDDITTYKHSEHILEENPISSVAWLKADFVDHGFGYKYI